MSGNNGASGAAAATAAQERRETMLSLRGDDNRHWIDSSARWIRMAGCETEDGLYLDFARRFTAPATAEGTGEFVLEISAVSRYEVAVNAETIGAGPAAGSASLRFYHRYTVPRECLRPGPDANLLTVLLFHDGPNVATVQGFTYGEPGLLARLWAGETCIAVTDESWRVRHSPVFSRAARMVSAWGGFKEFYHGENRDDWRLPEFDHSQWSRAAAVADPLSPRFARNLALCVLPELEESLAVPARLVEASPALGRIALQDEYRTLPAAWSGAPITIGPGEPGAMPSLTLDFGTIMVGYPEITFSGPSCVFEVWYGETLEMARLDVVHTGAAEGETIWRAFHRRGFRFLKIVVIALSAETTLTRVTQHNAWYAYDRRGSLTVADPQLQQTLDVTRHTMRANSSYHYEDCPVREQALWILDLRVMSLVNYYLFGNPELTAKCLRQCFALQNEEGAIPATGPWPNTSYNADFPLHLAATVREYFEHTGDRALPEEALPFLRRMAGWIDGWREKSGDGLLDTDCGGAPPPFLDWSGRIEKMGKTTILNALYKAFLEDMAFFERHFGDPARSPGLTAQAQGVAASANRLLFDREEGVYRDAWRQGRLLPTVSRQANMAALYAGFVTSKAQAEALLARLDADENRFPSPFGPSFYLIIFEALARQQGRLGAIRGIIRRYWGAMLERGATTWWEVFDPTTPRWLYPHTFLGNIPTFERDEIPISACHGWSGAPGYAVPRYLLGVDLSQVWRGRIVVGPGLPEVRTGAQYVVPVAGGMLRLSFCGEDGVDVLEAPPGITVLTKESAREAAAIAASAELAALPGISPRNTLSSRAGQGQANHGRD